MNKKVIEDLYQPVDNNLTKLSLNFHNYWM